MKGSKATTRGSNSLPPHPSAGLVNGLRDTYIPPMSEIDVAVEFVFNDGLDKDAKYLFEPNLTPFFDAILTSPSFFYVRSFFFTTVTT